MTEPIRLKILCKCVQSVPVFTSSYWFGFASGDSEDKGKFECANGKLMENDLPPCIDCVFVATSVRSEDMDTHQIVVFPLRTVG